MGAAKLAGLVPTALELTRVIAQATAHVETALSIGGYGAALATSYLADASDCPEAIQLVAYGTFARLAYSRCDLPIPPDIQESLYLLEDMRLGKVEIPGLSRDVGRQPGGVVVTSSTTHPQIFNRAKMTGW